MTTTTDPALDEQVDDAEVANGSSAPHDGPNDGPGNELVPRGDAGELSTTDGPDPDPDSDSESDSPGADSGDDDDDADDPSEDLPTSSQPPALPASSDASEPVATGLSTKQKVMLGAFFAIAFAWALVLFWLWVRGVSLLVIVPGGILVSIALARRQLLGRLFAPATSRRPVPTQGRPALLYALLNNRVIAIPYVPDLSDEEKAAIREREETDYDSALQDEIIVERTAHVWLRQNTEECVECVFSGPTGGVGKGTGVTNTAAIAAVSYPEPVLLIDSRDGVGNDALRFGLVVFRWSDKFLKKIISYATPTVRQAIQMHKAGMFSTGKGASHWIRSAPSIAGQLDIIGCDIKGEDGKPLPAVDVSEFNPMVDDLGKTYGLIFHENANVRNLPSTNNGVVNQPLDVALMTRVDIPFFMHRPPRQFSDIELEDCLDTYRLDPGYNAKIANNGVLMILETGPEDTVEEYADMFNIPAHRTVLVPRDGYYVVKSSDYSGRDSQGHRRLPTLDTSSTPPEPIVDPDRMPPVGFLAMMQGLNAGLYSLLKPEQQHAFLAWFKKQFNTQPPRWAIAPEKKEDSRDHGES